MTLLAIPCQAQFITGLYNTGVTSLNGLVAGGAVDSHYTLTSTDPAFSGSNLPSYVLSGWAGWTNNSASGTGAAKWIGPQADESNPSHPNANYTYTTTFFLTGATPSAARIQLRFAADDSVTVRLNGVNVLTNVGGYNSLTIGTISSNFVSGQNTLSFETHNTGGGPTGLLVEATASVAPEPSALGMMLVVLPLLGGMAARKRL